MTTGRSRAVRSHAELVELIDAATVAPAVFELRPDYRVLLVAADGIEPADRTEAGEVLLGAAETSARALTLPVDQVAHVAAWREAYRAFGGKPQRTRNSLEALLRRADTGLPRVNPLTDLYNAISVRHTIPVGGEDLDHYVGPPRLIRADGSEEFVTTAGGEPLTEHPAPGEVVWCDDAGVTCRRWNWRQTTRTRLRDDTRAALFVFDALNPITDSALCTAGDDLIAHLTTAYPDVVVAQRLVGAASSDR